MALGAIPATLVRRLVGEGMSVVAVGLALGTAGALASTRLISSLLFGVSERDPMLFVAVPATFLLVAACASFVPAWRAAKVHPMEVLK